MIEKIKEKSVKTVKLSDEDKFHIKKQNILPFRYSERYKKHDPKYWVEWYKYKYKRKKLFLVNMYMRNKTIDTFTVSNGGKFFEKNKGLYYIDPDMTTRDIKSGLATLIYHEDVSAPFKIEFDVDELIRTLEGSNNENIKQTINPTAFKQFFNSQVIEKVLSGGELDKRMGRLEIFMIITGLATVINLILLLQMSGVIR